MTSTATLVFILDSSESCFEVKLQIKKSANSQKKSRCLHHSEVNLVTDFKLSSGISGQIVTSFIAAGKEKKNGVAGGTKKKDRNSEETGEVSFRL